MCARQLEMDLRKGAGRGAPGRRRRPGAGRPPNGPRPSERHETRPFHDARVPVHVVIRTAPGARLRGRRGWAAVRHGLLVTAARTRFRVVHVSIQATHMHAIVEADDRVALARGMQGFQIACARRFHRLRGTRGQIFADRYHAVALRSPRQVHHALGYVLNNWRRHREDTESRARFDPYSSAHAFPGWSSGASFRRDLDRLPVVGAATWLLALGWRRHGDLSPFARPGRPPPRAARDSEPRDELDRGDEARRQM